MRKPRVREGEGSFLQNFSVTFAANALGFLVSALTAIIIPQLIGTTNYAYWQLYLIYYGYMLYFSFGLTDGIYVRYGGKTFNEVEPKTISGQFLLLFGLNTLLNVGIVFFFLRGGPDEGKTFAMILAAIAGVAAVSRSLLTLLLQATNRMRVAASAVMLERLIFVLGIGLAAIIGRLDFRSLMLADLVGKVLSLVYVIAQEPALVFTRPERPKQVFAEAKENFTVGVKIVLAALCIVFGIGFLRQSIEQFFGLEVFAQVSLSLSLSNMFMIFVNALAVVLFPTLRRIDPYNLPELYRELETVTVLLLSGLFALYVPMRLILQIFLPSYEAGLGYMALLFPIFLFDGKMSLLIATYLKAMNRTNQLLFANALSFLSSLLLSYLILQGRLSLELSILAILLIQVIRCVAGELLLGWSSGKAILRELVLTGAFLLTHRYLESWIASFLYLAVYLVFVYLSRHTLKQTYHRLKRARGADHEAH